MKPSHGISVLRFMPIVIFILIIFSCSCRNRERDNLGTSDGTLEQLDKEIARSDIYVNDKIKRISDLESRLSNATGHNEKSTIRDLIITEYEAFNADSALYYINHEILAAQKTGDSSRENAMRIRKADVQAHAGLFAEALSTLSAIKSQDLDKSQLDEYYAAYLVLYQYLCEYNFENRDISDYEHLRELYTDSILAVSPEGSLNALCYGVPALVRRGEHDKALHLIGNHLNEYTIGTRQYSILASIMAYVFDQAGNRKESMRYMTLTAISDIQGAVKENMSFRAMATMLFESGDIERAHTYLKKSFEDANFYSARLRIAQTSRMLPIIDDAIIAKQNEISVLHTRQMIWLGIFAVVLAIGILIIYHLYIKSRAAGRKLENANSELSTLSAQLKETNEELESRNKALKVSDSTKEAYSRLFMEYCSTAISALQSYHKSMRVLFNQGNMRAIERKLETFDIVDKSLQEFYTRFDTAILDIYPSFVEKVNALLKPGEESVIKQGELLNTELRIFALIRLGVDDSAKIADFLRCSITTVYTYRSKMRKRAVSPDTFDADIQAISIA